MRTSVRQNTDMPHRQFPPQHSAFVPCPPGRPVPPLYHQPNLYMYQNSYNNVYMRPQLHRIQPPAAIVQQSRNFMPSYANNEKSKNNVGWKNNNILLRYFNLTFFFYCSRHLSHIQAIDKPDQVRRKLINARYIILQLIFILNKICAHVGKSGYWFLEKSLENYPRWPYKIGKARSTKTSKSGRNIYGKLPSISTKPNLFFVNISMSDILWYIVIQWNFP